MQCWWTIAVATQPWISHPLLVAICNHDTSNLSCARAACALVLLHVHAGSDIPYLGQHSLKSIYKTKGMLKLK